MPRLNDKLLDCAAYLYRSEADANGNRRAGGSGFLLGVPLRQSEPLLIPPVEEQYLLKEGDPVPSPWDAGDPFLYLVTNSHVIRDGHKFVRLNTWDGKRDTLPLNSWVHHSASDLAVHLLDWTLDRHRFAFVPFEMILTKRNSFALDVGIGDDVFSIGRFVNHEGKKRNLPVARFGHIAMMPKEPVIVHYRQDGALRPAYKRSLESFLVESRTVPGYSGSPVFLRIPPWEMCEYDRGHLRREIYEHQGQQSGGSIGLLLGVTWGYIWGQEESVLDPVTKKEIGRVNLNSGMAGVLPGWQLLELLNCKELIEQRNEKRRLLEEQEDPPGGVLC